MQDKEEVSDKKLEEQEAEIKVFYKTKK